MTTRITTSNIDPTALIAIQGPIISSIQVTSNNYVVLDDTAVDTAGGFIRINGNNFTSSTQVIIGSQLATSVTFVNSSTLNVQVPAQSAGTYTVYITNNNGDVAIMVMGVTYSSIPAWSTGSTLPGGVVNNSLSIQLNASGDGSITYAVANGSSLPPGLTLSSNGLLSGAVTGITSETTYNFNVNAIDAQLQDASRTFSITIAANDPNFRNITTLLSASNPSSTFVSDASANSFAITVNGDARPSNFGPYTPGYYSNYFTSTNAFTVPDSAAWDLNTDITVEAFCYLESYNTSDQYYIVSQVATGQRAWGFGLTNGKLQVYYTTNGSTDTFIYSNSFTVTAGQWYHFAFTRTSAGVYTFYVNGVATGSTTDATVIFTSNQPLTIGQFGNFGISTLGWKGFISNLRFVRGSIVYTGNFTPSTTPLTAITNTQLLTCQSNRFIDNSTNNFTVTVSGSMSVSGFDPFVPSASFAGRGSAFFDGTGDFLSAPDNAALNLGSGDYTIEGWWYFTDTSNQAMVSKYTANNGYVVQYQANTLRMVLGLGSSDAVYSFAWTMIPNTWNHVAITRSGTSGRAFVNGVQIGSTTTFTTSNTSAAATLQIGSTHTVSELTRGYVTDVRIVKGTAVYTANFTPPTAPLTAIANTSLLTLQNNQPNNNSMFLDNSTNNFNITRNGNVTQGTFSPYGGGWSNYFDGSTTYLNTSSSANLGFGTGDFTVEFFIYPTATPSTCSLYHGSTTNSFIINTTSDGRLVIRQYGIADLFTSAAALSLNTWNHVAVARSGTTISLWLNGSRSSGVTGTNSTNWATTAVYIGRADSVTNIVQGYISNVRAVKGTAIYNPANATITVPTTPLTPVSGTSLLTCADNRFIDDSANNLTITRNGSPTVQRFNPFSPTITTPTSYSAFFDGTGDWLSGIGTVSSFNFMHNTSALFTIEAWVYTGTTGAQQTIACTNGVAASASVGFWFVIETDNTLRLFVTKGSAGNPVINAVSSGTVPLNSWTHVAVTYNQSLASNNATFYINGVLSGTATKTANAPVDSNAGNALNIGSFQGGGTYMVGYISNLRITNSIVYTGAFTPSATPLTAVANTALLTCQSATLIDNSTNNFTITNNGDTAPRQFNPFGWTNITSSSAAYTTALYGGSGYFDGTGDYLLGPSGNSAFAMGTGDFTLECWLYLNAKAAGTHFFSVGNGSGTTWLLGLNNTPNFEFYAAGASRITGTTNPILSAWYHVAISRVSGSTRLFVNGVQEGSTYSDTNNYTCSSGFPIIGIRPELATPMNGYMSDLRVIKGQARYTSNFQPPIAPLTALPNTVLLNNMTSAGIYDSSMITTYETIGNASINTSVKKYGNTSLYFDGTGDHLYAPWNPGLELGSGNFTIEFWAYISGGNALYCWSTDWHYGMTFNYGGASSNRVGIWASSNGSSWNIFNADGGGNGISTGTITLNTWTHVALVRNGSTWTLYLNGTSAWTGTSSATIVTRSSDTFRIGGPWPNSGPAAFNGYMDDFRITNGIARYTANFTPPTAPFIQF